MLPVLVIGGIVLLVIVVCLVVKLKNSKWLDNLCKSLSSPVVVKETTSDENIETIEDTKKDLKTQQVKNKKEVDELQKDSKKINEYLDETPKGSTVKGKKKKGGK
jgi:prefoldin subunit 5